MSILEQWEQGQPGELLRSSKPTKVKVDMRDLDAVDYQQVRAALRAARHSDIELSIMVDDDSAEEVLRRIRDVIGEILAKRSA